MFDITNGGGISGTLLYNGTPDHPVAYLVGQNLTVDQIAAGGHLLLLKPSHSADTPSSGPRVRVGALAQHQADRGAGQVEILAQRIDQVAAVGFGQFARVWTRTARSSAAGC